MMQSFTASSIRMGILLLLLAGMSFMILVGYAKKPQSMTGLLTPTAPRGRDAIWVEGSHMR
jgi:hypothetical protein